MDAPKKKVKKPGRFKRECVKCKKPFSTHSTNRESCHVCVPKCIAIHHFDRAKKTTEINKTSSTNSVFVRVK